jgi:hypothetical protein
VLFVADTTEEKTATEAYITIYTFCGATAIAGSASQFPSLACRLAVVPVEALTLGATIRHRFAAFTVHQGACCLAALLAGISHCLVVVVAFLVETKSGLRSCGGGGGVPLPPLLIINHCAIVPL